MRFGYTVLQHGHPLFTGLGPRFSTATDARWEAELQALAAGLTGELEIEVGMLAAGMVCVQRRVFRVPPSQP
jgi:hypothetical protein